VTGNDELRVKLHMQEIHVRLLNWGRWLRWDSTIARLGYPTEAPWVFSPRRGQLIADLDAEHIEWVVSTMYISKDFSPLGHLHAFILRVEYAERSEDEMPAVEQRAEDVQRRFKTPCHKSTYYNHIIEAKKMVFSLAGPIK